MVVSDDFCYALFKKVLDLQMAIPYIMNRVRYSGFLGRKMFVICKKVTVLMKSLETYFFGPPLKNNTPADYTSLLLCSSDTYEKKCRVIAAQLKGYLDQSSTVVMVTPWHEPSLVTALNQNSPATVLVLFPHNLEEIQGMVNILINSIDNIVIMSINVSQIPCIGYFALHETHYDTIFMATFERLKRLSSRFNCPLMVVDNLDTMTQRNSALLRRLFPRNTILKG